MQTFLKKAELSKRTGLNSETLRYYEKIGLIDPPIRAANGYRLFTEETIERLIFIKSCRSLGFSIEEIKALLALQTTPNESCQNVHVLIDAHRQLVAEKMLQLQTLQQMLDKLASDDQSDVAHCTVIKNLHTAGLTQTPIS